jgi:hypothetical protein
MKASELYTEILRKRALIQILEGEIKEALATMVQRSPVKVGDVIDNQSGNLKRMRVERVIATVHTTYDEEVINGERHSTVVPDGIELRYHGTGVKADGTDSLVRPHAKTVVMPSSLDAVLKEAS